MRLFSYFFFCDHHCFEDGCECWTRKEEDVERMGNFFEWHFVAVTRLFKQSTPFCSCFLVVCELFPLPLLSLEIPDDDEESEQLLDNEEQSVLEM